jgi:hypothetical protein
MQTNKAFPQWHSAAVMVAILICANAFAQVEQSPLSSARNGRTAGNNDRIVTTGIRSPPLPSNHALIISVSAYTRHPLPGVLKDRLIATQLAERFGVPPENIAYLSEQDVTREGLQHSIDKLDKKIMPGDKLYIYFSGHGARFMNKANGQCTESLVMQDLHVVTNDEFADMVKPLSAKADKTVVMLDACHAGGVAEAAGSRDLFTALHKSRAKFDADVSSAACANPVNLRGFSGARGIEFETTDNNLVILAAARKNEVAWDTDDGGAMTYSFLQCVNGGAVDKDSSGSISMQELTDCVQAHLDRDEELQVRQHLTLTGNGGLVPGFSQIAEPPPPAPQPAPPQPSPPQPSPQPSPPAPAPAPAPGPAPAVNTLAALHDIYNQRDDRWGVAAAVSKPVMKIRQDFLDLTITSQRDGFIYIFYMGSRPDSFYLLFPNQLDEQNAIKANEAVMLPRRAWTVNALGPAGTDHLLVMVAGTPRDLGDYSLPVDYVSRSGPFGKIAATAQAVARINQIATLSTAFKNPECQRSADRDLAVAKRCSNAFGAALVSVDEQ